MSDAFELIDQCLGLSPYLVGNQVSEADKLLYQTLLRLDHIDYYLSKINFAKSFDYEHLKTYVTKLFSCQRLPIALIL
ncbi:glutathione binding-like protein [Streptococcus sp. H31]|uniref:glutathione binding-like protein n=1 Tax=Streptococcus huangxiaojuni TaxID=3237239 RepID=UPI0034A58238